LVWAWLPSPGAVERRTFPIPILDQPVIQVLAEPAPSVVASDDEWSSGLVELTGSDLDVEEDDLALHFREI
jgi:hypothetical protein